MNSYIYAGQISHIRYIPKRHGFSYPFFMWYLDLEEIERGVRFGRWFSSQGWALSRFLRSDYLGQASQPLAEAVKQKMEELTGKAVSGKVFGLMNLRTLGLYFSPVNFYFGFDAGGGLSHFLAEVSNTPWNERHYYGNLLGEGLTHAVNPKSFKVSPFNPENGQVYTWQIGVPGQDLFINLALSDERGQVFKAALRLHRNPFTRNSIARFLKKIPVMTIYIIAKIYWQALRIFVRGIPYIPYNIHGCNHQPQRKLKL